MHVNLCISEARGPHDQCLDQLLRGVTSLELHGAEDLSSRVIHNLSGLYRIRQLLDQRLPNGQNQPQTTRASQHIESRSCTIDSLLLGALLLRDFEGFDDSLLLLLRVAHCRSERSKGLRPSGARMPGLIAMIDTTHMLAPQRVPEREEQLVQTWCDMCSGTGGETERVEQ